MDIIFRYFPDLEAEARQKLLALEAGVRNWNEKINLISRKDIDELSERHVLHSLSITRYFNFLPGSEVIDVGTGGGFPGLVLASVFPEVNFTLLDATRKKISAVASVAESLNLTNVRAVWERAEAHNSKYDFVLGRAVSTIPAFYRLTRHLINRNSRHSHENGIIYLKGGDWEAETNSEPELLKNIKVYKIYDFIPLPFFETKLILYLPNQL